MTAGEATDTAAVADHHGGHDRSHAVDLGEGGQVVVAVGHLAQARNLYSVGDRGIDSRQWLGTRLSGIAVNDAAWPAPPGVRAAMSNLAMVLGTRTGYTALLRQP